LSASHYYTGFVPLYLKTWEAAETIETYRGAVFKEIAKSLSKLESQSNVDDWASIEYCTIAYLLRLQPREDAWSYDRKFSYVVKPNTVDMMEVLFPMVEEALID
jgi:hypothetical protein